MFGLFNRDRAPRERRLKLHDVQASLYDTHRKNFSATLWQTHWSDGTGKFRLWLPKLRDAPGGEREARLLLEGVEVSRFELSRRELHFEWRGPLTEDLPKFEIGRKVRLEVGEIAFEGIVEAD